ncbi:hypothetical protein HY988_04905 [Candidatus Micrarchaeota archaeon]|nr:hypothetical protein [Candidatus Micrarchaeota archaeon]
MLEDVLFGNLSMPGELIRVVVAFLGVAVTAYYDLFNKKNVPNNILYGFLAIAFLVNLIFFQSDIFWFSIALSVLFGIIGFVFYRAGQLGAADIFVISSIVLLLPLHPSFVGLSFNLPFIFSTFIFSGVVFALFILLSFGWKLYKMEEVKPKLMYALLFIPYLLFAYVYMNSFLFSAVYFALISVLLFATIFFLIFKDDINKMLCEERTIPELEPEDVLALELMNKDMIDRYKLPRLITQKEIERLQKTKLEKVSVYTNLPPFLPFLLIGMILSLVFARSLLLF